MTTNMTNKKIIDRTYVTLKYTKQAQASVYKVVTELLTEALNNCDIKAIVVDGGLNHYVELKMRDILLRNADLSYYTISRSFHALLDLGFLVCENPETFSTRGSMRISTPEFAIQLPAGRSLTIHN